MERLQIRDRGRDYPYRDRDRDYPYIHPINNGKELVFDDWLPKEQKRVRVKQGNLPLSDNYGKRNLFPPSAGKHGHLRPNTRENPVESEYSNIASFQTGDDHLPQTMPDPPFHRPKELTDSGFQQASYLSLHPVTSQVTGGEHVPEPPPRPVTSNQPSRTASISKIQRRLRGSVRRIASTTREARCPIVVMIVSIICCLGLLGGLIYMALKPKGDSSTGYPIYVDDVNMAMTFIGKNFTTDMYFPSSTDYQKFQQEFCSQVVQKVLRTNSTILAYDSNTCRVTKLEPGSIRVYFSFIVAVGFSAENHQAFFVDLFLSNKDSFGQRWTLNESSLDVLTINVKEQTDSNGCRLMATAMPMSVNTESRTILPIIETGHVEFTLTNLPQTALSLSLLRDHHHLTSFVLTGTEIDVNVSRAIIKVRRFLDHLIVNLTLHDVTCEDEGRYVLQARGNGAVATHEVDISVSEKPSEPNISLPLELIENKTVINPYCWTTEVGYNPVTSFAWTLEGKSFDVNRFSNTYYGEGCALRGNSTLQADRYVAWNGRTLCCQLVNRTSVVVETCRTLRVAAPVLLTSLSLDQHVHMKCVARAVTPNATVEMYLDGQELGICNASGCAWSHQRLSLARDYVNGIVTVKLTWMNVTCADSGTVTCVVTDDSVTRSHSAPLTPNRPPDSLHINFPYSGNPAEGHSLINPTCDVGFLGCYPTADLRWELSLENGIKNITSVPIPHTADHSFHSSVTLDAQKYVGWNNSDLCCQLVHPTTRAVIKEDCQRGIKLIPNNYCDGHNGANLENPYNRHLWIQCSSGVIYPNGPCPNNQCWYDNNQCNDC